MAIFIALIFQVLFVLFAMAINVALIVHDKINLQNAVDLAAYYAAQRQAELLNVIAHQNYQIRQSWKLLSWRYRVLGTMGLDRPPFTHPTVIAGNGQAFDRREIVYEEGFEGPGVCIGFFPIWLDAPNNENPCNEPNKDIPRFPVVPVIAGFNPINAIISNLSIALRSRFQARCSFIGAYNWWFANAILHAFREDQKNRKEVIFAIADSLSRASDTGDFTDLRGESVLAGVQQIVTRNLTFANQQGAPEIQMMNSLAGVPRQAWLPEINISPILLYLDAVNLGNDGGCNTRKVLSSNLPTRGDARNFAQTQLDDDNQTLQLWAQGALFDVASTYNLSLGVEKNPWYPAYVGVKATTRSRQLFMPFGGSITLTARAFAKPFGGRIGPWYGARWPRTSPRSVGTKVDALVPPRIDPASPQFENVDDPTRIPNYSRFPGDNLGLGSRLAQAALNGQRNMRISYLFFREIFRTMNVSPSKDILAWNNENPTDQVYRNFELAALAPDLFDITYYSVEPNFEENYRRFLLTSRAALGIPQDIPIRGDLGARDPDVPSFAIQNQMTVAAQIRGIEAFYFAQEKSHLLTGWVPNSRPYVDFATFPAERFGRCQINDDQRTPKNPGSCIQGGRVGYSVKLVARDLLLRGALEIGGNGEAAGQIRNPPPAGDGW